MAQQSILKLAVDVSDYEPKMRRAVKVIDDMRQALASQGRDFTAADEEMTQFLRDLGQMDTKVRGTRGSLMEMTRAVADMTVAYGGLSDTEKASPFGVELQNTINTVTERAGQLRDAMDDASASIQHAASDTRTFDQLAQGASVATSAFQVMQGAGKLLGVEMGDNVEVLARLQAAMSITTGLTTIQNAVQKQSALMQGIMAVQAKAAAAAQALLAANTGKATAAQRLFNAVAKANPYMLLVTGITAVVGVLGLFGDSSDEATEKTNTLKNAIDSLNASMEFNIQLAEKMGASSETLAEMRLSAAKQELELARQRQQSLVETVTYMSGATGKKYADGYEEASQAVIDAAKKEAAAERELAQIRVTRIRLMNTWDKGETDKEIRARINALREELDVTKKGTEAYTDLSNKITQLEGQLKSTSPTPARTGGGGGRGGNTGRATQAETPVTVTESLTELQVLEDALQTVRNSMEGYSPISDEWKEMNAEAERLTETINRMNGVVKEMGTGTSITNSRGMDEYISMLQEQLSQADFGSSIYSSIEAQLADTSTLKDLLQQSMKVGLGTSLFDAMDLNGESIWEKVLSPEGVEDADWDAIVAAINAKREELDLPPIVLDVKTGDISETAKKVKSGWNDAADAIRSVGNALSQIEDPTAKVLGIIAEAIATIALTFAKSLEKTFTPWDWIAAAAAGTATMISTIAAIKSATAGSYAQGGIVPGNSYSGDRLTANVNSGELILSRAQQDSIAMQLQDSGTPEMHLTATITGEQIRLALNNNARRTGRGEYVTTRFT